MTKMIFGVLMFFFLSQPVVFAQDQDAQKFEGFNLTGYENDGKKSWDIKGDTADIQGSTINMTNIVANSYGKEQMNVTAERGSMDKGKGDMHLEKDVVITTESGTRLVTDSLDWQMDKDLVTTDDPVHLTKQSMTATGNGARAHPSLNSAQINENVTVNVNTDPESELGRIITVTCDGPLEVKYELGKAVFNNNVVAVDGDRKLMADKIELFVNTQTNEIKEMICTGHVVIVQGDNTAYADKAVYRALDQKLTLLGQPKLQFYTQDNGSGPFGQKEEKTQEKEE